MYSNDKVLLKQLSVNDADFIYKLYSNSKVTVDFDKCPFLPNETPEEFTKRLISACEYIFTIRQKANPGLIVGECALHHWNKDTNEVEIGGSLSPEYWGKGIMRSAFELLTEIAKQIFGVKTLIGITTTKNYKAIRMAEQMGFAPYGIDDTYTIMRKNL